MNILIYNELNMTSKDFPKITYYLYDYSGILAKKPKKIYSPYNFKILGRTPNEDYFRNPDAVEFQGGVYILDVDNVGEKRYEEQKEWLGFYNRQGGVLRKGTGEAAELINGRKYRNDGIHIIQTEKIPTANDPVIKEVKTKVEVQQIPRIIAETMNLPQIEKLAASWNVELPKDMRESGNAGEVVKKIVDLLEEAGHIS